MRVKTASKHLGIDLALFKQKMYDHCQYLEKENDKIGQLK